MTGSGCGRPDRHDSFIRARRDRVASGPIFVTCIETGVSLTTGVRSEAICARTVGGLGEELRFPLGRDIEPNASESSAVPIGTRPMGKGRFLPRYCLDNKDVAAET